MARGLLDIVNAIQEAQLQSAKNMYEAQTRAAGTSIEKKIIAEKKYEQEQKKINAKMAIANKLQAIFEIGLQLALAEATLNIPQVIAAGLALGAVLATPIPAYEKGGKNKAGLARVSEKGSELHIGDDGSLALTPDKETVANFPAGEFVPHDETQRMLAGFAMKQNNDMLDLSKTNGYLRAISKNTRSMSSDSYNNGVRTIVRGHVKSRIL